MMYEYLKWNLRSSGAARSANLNLSRRRSIDRGFWHNDADVMWVKAFMEFWVRRDEDKASLEPLFQAPIGGKDARLKIAWLMVLLLAVRRLELSVLSM